MSETKHTPGPWMWNKHDELVPAEQWMAYERASEAARQSGDYSEVDYVPAIVETDSGYYGPRGGDRHLIAAAPELLEALKGTRMWLKLQEATMTADTYTHPVAKANIRGDIERAEAAIAKAEGR